MKYRSFSSTALKVSEICLGTMQFKWTTGEAESYKVLDAFFEAGGNFIDTADMYTQWAKGLKGGEAETVIGHWMKKRKNRDKIVLATKVRCKIWEGSDGEGLSRSHVLKACEASLKRLQTDYIDLYQSHWPDAETPQEETLSTYHALVQQGKVRHIGCSNYSAKEMEEAFSKGKKIGVQYISVQPRYNLVWRKDFEKNILPMVLERNLSVIPYSPLEGGFLTGKYRKDKPMPKSERADGVKEKMTEKNLAVIELLEQFGAQYHKTVSQMALGWLLSHDWMTAPIIGANSVEQLNESLGASGFRLQSKEKEALDQLTEGL